MNRKTKIWLLVGAGLVLSGVLILIASMVFTGWDFAELSTVEYETVTHEIQEDFSNFSIDITMGNVEFHLSEDGSRKVICHETEDLRYSVRVEDDTLTVTTKDERKWFNHIGIDFGKAKVALYLPKGEYDTLFADIDTGNLNVSQDFSFHSIDISGTTGDVECLASASGNMKIDVTTGRIGAEDVEAERLDLSVTTGSITLSRAICRSSVNLSVTTGKITLNDVQCQSLSALGSTGDIDLENVIATGTLSAEMDTGDITLEDCDGGNLSLQTDTGDISGNLLTEKVFHATTDTGDVRVPNTASGGICEITTDTGDIHITVG